MLFCSLWRIRIIRCLPDLFVSITTVLSFIIHILDPFLVIQTFAIPERMRARPAERDIFWITTSRFILAKITITFIRLCVKQVTSKRMEKCILSRSKRWRLSLVSNLYDSLCDVLMLKQTNLKGLTLTKLNNIK